DFLLTLTAEYIDRHLERPLLHPPAFSYRCNSQQLFRYNIDAASFLELNVNPLPAAGPLKSSLSNVEIASLMTGLHAPEIIRMVKSGESLSSREIMAGVLGAISGYSFGKWIGT